MRRTIRWRRLDGPGIETFRLASGREGWHLRGELDVSFDDVPAKVIYEIACDREWSTRAVRTWVEMGGTRRGLRIRVDTAGRWFCDGRERRDLRGCVDVDLSITPATNTLPIRRLALREGSSSEVPVAWIRFPDLTVAPLRQRYTRLSRDRVRYENLDSGFSVVFEVDKDGLVVSYPGAWLRAPNP